MSLKLRALQGAVWNAVENVGSQLTSFVLFLVFARLISPDAIGVVQMAITLLGFLTIFVEHGFSAVIIRAPTLRPAMLNTAFWLGLGGGTTLAVALTLSADAIALAYRSPELAHVLRVLAWTVPLTTLSCVQTALLIRNLAFKTQALRRLVAVLGGGIVGVWLALLDYGVWSLVARLLVEAAIDCAIAWGYTDFRPGTSLSRSEARGFASFGSRIVGSYAVGFLNRRTDELLIGFVLGPVALGYYAVAARAMSLVTEVALRAAQRTAVPVLSKLQDEPERLRETYYTAVELAAVVACPVFVGLSAVAPELCVTMFGAKWAPVVPAMQILGLAGVAMSIAIYTAPVLISVGKPSWLFQFTLAETVINVAAAAIAVRFGIVAVAIAYVVRSYVALPLVLAVTQRALGTRSLRVLRLVFPPGFSSLLMFAVVALVRGLLPSLPAAARLVLLVTAGGATYLGAMWLLGRRTMERVMSMLRLHREVRAAA